MKKSVTQKEMQKSIKLLAFIIVSISLSISIFLLIAFKNFTY